MYACMPCRADIQYHIWLYVHHTEAKSIVHSALTLPTTPTLAHTHTHRLVVLLYVTPCSGQVPSQTALVNTYDSVMPFSHALKLT